MDWRESYRLGAIFDFLRPDPNAAGLAPWSTQDLAIAHKGRSGSTRAVGGTTSGRKPKSGIAALAGAIRRAFETAGVEFVEDCGAFIRKAQAEG
jgi:hypothetical protein